MKNLKAISGGVFLALVMFFLMYLIGSFCAASFDFTKWDGPARSLGGIVGGIFSIGVGGAYILHNAEE